MDCLIVEDNTRLRQALKAGLDYIVDAIDNTRSKVALIAELNKMLGYYAEKEASSVPSFGLIMDLRGTQKDDVPCRGA